MGQLPNSAKPDLDIYYPHQVPTDHVESSVISTSSSVRPIEPLWGVGERSCSTSYPAFEPSNSKPGTRSKPSYTTGTYGSNTSWTFDPSKTVSGRNTSSDQTMASRTTTASDNSVASHQARHPVPFPRQGSNLRRRLVVLERLLDSP